MKKAVRLIITLAGACILLSCSGCFYLATAVSHTGVRQECLRANRILIATNGSIALDCTAAYFHPTLFGGGGEQVFETRKYLIGSPAVVRWTVTNALAAGKSSFDRSTNLIEIKQLIYATTRAGGDPKRSATGIPRRHFRLSEWQISL